MNWIAFLGCLFASVVFELSLLDVIEIGGLKPSLLGVLAVFVALWAPRMTALWGCFFCGLSVDLTTSITFGGGQVAYIFGPYALGYVFACSLMLQIRTMVMRRQTFAVAILAGVFVVMASIVGVAFYTARSWYSPELEGFSAVHALLRQVGVGIYTSLLAAPVGWLLLKSFSYWHFPGVSPSLSNWR